MTDQSPERPTASPTTSGTLPVSETRVAATLADIDTRTQREVANLKEIIDTRDTAIQGEMDRRFEAANRLVELVAANLKDSEACQRAITNGAVATLEARLDGMDRANVVLQETVTRVPTDVQLQVGNLRDVMGERFNSIDKQFVERDVRSEREARDNKCVTVDTPILCADLIWRPAGDLQVGDKLIAFDRDAPKGRGGRSGRASRGRTFVKATVTGNRAKWASLVAVTTPRGTVRCTHDHPWLSRKPRATDGGRRWGWVHAERLQPGDEVLHLVDVWRVDRSYEAGWLSGILDGEGCLSFNSGDGTGGRIGIVQRVSPTAERIRVAVEGFGVGFRTKERFPAEEGRRASGPGRQSDNWQPVVTFALDIRADVMKVLGTIRPERLLEEADRVWEGRTITGKHRMTTVTSVEPAGWDTIASLSTSAGTYIAGGFAMRNTAVDAAFSAQKESATKQDESNAKAIDKSETATKETINKLNDLLDALNRSLSGKIDDGLKTASDKIDDLKARVGAIEAATRGMRDSSQDRRADTGTLAAIIGLVFTAIIVGLALFAALHK